MTIWSWTYIRWASDFDLKTECNTTSTPSSRSTWCCCWRSRGTRRRIPRGPACAPACRPIRSGRGLREAAQGRPSLNGGRLDVGAATIHLGFGPSTPFTSRRRRRWCPARRRGRKMRPPMSSARTADGDLCMRYNGLYFHLSDDCV
jgi:hypothetical protein